MCTVCVFKPLEVRRGHKNPWNCSVGVRHGPLKEQYVLLSTELALQPLGLNFKKGHKLLSKELRKEKCEPFSEKNFKTMISKFCVLWCVVIRPTPSPYQGGTL